MLINLRESALVLYFNFFFQMNKDIDFTKLSNSEINLKMKSFDNEYNVKKTNILSLIKDLQDLDEVYNKAKEELSKRGVLNDG